MPYRQWLAVATLALAPFTATAEQKQPQYSPTDANAPVNPLVYDSAFKHYDRSATDDQSPDQVWRTAHEELGKPAGHGEHAKDDAAQSAPGISSQPGPAKSEHADHNTLQRGPQ